MCCQNAGCAEPYAAVSVSLPTDLNTRMTAEAADRNCTVDQMVEEAFSHLRGRICPEIRGD